MKLNKDFIPLQKAYKFKLQEHLNKNITELNSPIEYFITYLKFLRDYHLFEAQRNLDDTITDIKVISLMTAIEEYENFKNCIHKYYNIDKQKAVRKATFSEEEAANKYAAEKQFHWNTF